MPGSGDESRGQTPAIYNESNLVDCVHAQSSRSSYIRGQDLIKQIMEIYCIVTKKLFRV